MQRPCCIFANMWLAREEKTGRSHVRSESYSKGRQSFTKKWSQGPISSLTVPVEYLHDVKTKPKPKKFLCIKFSCFCCQTAWLNQYWDFFVVVHFVPDTLECENIGLQAILWYGKWTEWELNSKKALWHSMFAKPYWTLYCFKAIKSPASALVASELLIMGQSFSQNIDFTSVSSSQFSDKHCNHLLLYKFIMAVSALLQSVPIAINYVNCYIKHTGLTFFIRMTHGFNLEKMHLEKILFQARGAHGFVHH